MTDALTDFIIKPAAPFAAGVVLFGVVWGFFKGVESILTDDTKLEIAVWLVGVKIGQKVSASRSSSSSRVSVASHSITNGFRVPSIKFEKRC